MLSCYIRRTIVIFGNYILNLFNRLTKVFNCVYDCLGLHCLLFGIKNYSFSSKKWRFLKFSDWLILNTLGIPSVFFCVCLSIRLNTLGIPSVFFCVWAGDRLSYWLSLKDWLSYWLSLNIGLNICLNIVGLGKQKRLRGRERLRKCERLRKRERLKIIYTFPLCFRVLHLRTTLNALYLILLKRHMYLCKKKMYFIHIIISLNQFKDIS